MKCTAVLSTICTSLLVATQVMAQSNPVFRVDYLGPASSVHAINAGGDCVGRQTLPSGNRRGWVALDGEALQLLPLPPGMVLSEAFDINDQGQIVGEVGDGVTHPHAATWVLSPGGGYTCQLLGSLPGMSHGSATTINNRGDILGYGITSGGGWLPALFASTGNVDLFLTYGFGEPPMDVNEQRQVISINDRLDLDTGLLEHNSFLLRMRATNETGQLVGTVPNGSQNLHAARFTPGFGLEILSSAQTTSPATIAYGLNERGDVVFEPESVYIAGVGSSYIHDLLRPSDKGWSFGSTMWDMDINDSRQILMRASNATLGLGGAVRLTPLGHVREYCTAKPNSLGCLPAISSSGTPSATAGSGFDVVGSNVRNNKSGLLLYGVGGRAALPFQGGTLCVATPIKRTRALTSGGTPAPANDCSGAFMIDMNAFALSAGPPAPLPALRQPGSVVNCQFWGRDQGFPAPKNTTLTDALEYVVGN